MRGNPRLWIVISVILALAVLGLGGFSWRLASRQGQLSQRAAAMETELAELSQELTRETATLAEGMATIEGQFSARLALTEQQLLSVEAGLSAELDRVEGALSERVNQAERSFSQEVRAVQGKLQEESARLSKDIGTLDVNLRQEMGKLTGQAGRALLDASQLYEQVKAGVVEVQGATSGGLVRGSGFLYGAGGLYIVTAYHVVAGATGLKVMAPERGEIGASLLGYDVAWDVAVLKLAQPLATAPLPLADSKKIFRGQPAMALGSPFGYTGSVTTGIVSNVNLPVTYEGRNVKYSLASAVQFDAAANPGNSGGPLFNAQGEVMGMVVASIKPDEGWGIGFAVPANPMEEAVAAILKRG